MPTGDNFLSVEDQVIAPVLTASLVYDDARQAIRWLVDILGFRIATFYETPNGGCGIRGARLENGPRIRFRAAAQ